MSNATAEPTTAVAVREPQPGSAQAPAVRQNNEAANNAQIAALAVYAGAGTIELAPNAAMKMTRPIEAMEELDVKPTGEIYMSHTHVRRRLNEAFGIARWALVPINNPIIHEHNGGKRVMREFRLMVNGAFVAQSMGAMIYYPNDNTGMDDALEGAESDALKRCAKKLGIGEECWDRRKAFQLRAEHCVQVRVKRKNGSIVEQWRRKDAPPFDNEVGVAVSDQAPTRQSSPVDDGVIDTNFHEDQPQRQSARSVNDDNDGAQEMAEGVIEHCGVKLKRNGEECRGERNGKKWCIWGVKMDGQLYETFSESIAKEACNFVRSKVPVRIYFERESGQFPSLKIKSIQAKGASEDQGSDMFDAGWEN